MKTDCSLIRGLLERFLDGELEPSETEQVTAHLADCPDCRRELAQLQALDHLVRQDEPPPLADEYWDWHRHEVWRHIRSGFRREYAPTLQRRFAWMRLATVAAGIAAIMIAVVGGWRLITGSPERAKPMYLAEEQGVRPGESVADRDQPGTADAVGRGAAGAGGTSAKRTATELEFAESQPTVANRTAGGTGTDVGTGGAVKGVAPTAGLVGAEKKQMADESMASAGERLPAVSEETSGQAAMARYEAFVDSVNSRLAQARTPAVAAKTGDRSARLLGYSPLPAAPGRDTVEVTVRALVKPDGSVIQVEVTRGTGDPTTDSLLRASFLRARFEPATRGGSPVESWFELDSELSPAPAAPAEDGEQ